VIVESPEVNSLQHLCRIESMNLKDFPEDDPLGNPLIPNLVRRFFENPTKSAASKRLHLKHLLETY
jgi:hypothetical protein